MSRIPQWSPILISIIVLDVLSVRCLHSTSFLNRAHQLLLVHESFSKQWKYCSTWKTLKSNAFSTEKEYFKQAYSRMSWESSTKASFQLQKLPGWGYVGLHQPTSLWSHCIQWALNKEVLWPFLDYIGEGVTCHDVSLDLRKHSYLNNI